MIELRHLTKIFKSKNKQKVTAVNDVSFVLPNKGLVFVVGKSGSGKTTLLSLIGGLDNLTSVYIIVDGNSLSEFKNNDFAYYRNTKIGFIFQDFHLLDNLTVFQNIELSLKLTRDKNDEGILEALKSVDLEGYANRLPKELSGGQKQRVAIVRTLIKNPSIILADEPTGNLDEGTSEQVFNLLKKVSKEKLVLVVTHDVIDARKYADRIIELSEGKVIGDYIRNLNSESKTSIEDETLFLPIHKEANDEEKELISKSLKENKIKHIKQVDDVFITNDKDENITITENKIKKSHFKFIDNMKLGFKFIKSQLSMMIVYSFIIAALACVMGLTQTVAQFDSSEVLENEFIKNNERTLALRKDHMKYDGGDYMKTTCVARVEENDADIIRNAGFEGEMYPLLLMSLPIRETILDDSRVIPQYYPNDIYYHCTLGNLITTEDYVKGIYGQNGEIVYERVADEIQPYGVYITDFTADSIIDALPSKYYDYDSIINKKVDNKRLLNAYFNGIIRTNYKERHKEAIDKLKDSDAFTSKLGKEKIVSDFVNEVYQYLSITYSFNENFYEDYVTSKVNVSANHKEFNFIYGDKNIIEKNKIYVHREEWLRDDEAIININLFNRLTGSNYTKDTLDQFVPTEIKVCTNNFYDIKQGYKNPTFTMKIRTLREETSLALSSKLYEEFLRYKYFNYGYYLRGLENISEVFDAAQSVGYTPVSSIVQPLTSITKIVTTFSSLFYMLFGIVAVCCVAVLINYNLKSIKDKLYEIGVLKSIGATDGDLFLIFSIQTFFITIFVSVLFVLGSYLFIGFANNLLVSSATEFSKGVVISKDIELLMIQPLALLIDVGVIFLISLLSFIFPVIKLRKIRPQNILKSQK